jgi:hypothetical protein
MPPTAIARVVHEALRAYRRELGEAPLPAWDDAPEWQRTATLAAVDFRLANPGAGLAAQHDAWVAQTRAAGWTHGPVHDAEARTHPDLLPYDRLPARARCKDALVAAVVRALAD